MIRLPDLSSLSFEQRQKSLRTASLLCGGLCAALVGLSLYNLIEANKAAQTLAETAPKLSRPIPGLTTEPRPLLRAPRADLPLRLAESLNGRLQSYGLKADVRVRAVRYLRPGVSSAETELRFVAPANFGLSALTFLSANPETFAVRRIAAEDRGQMMAWTLTLDIAVALDGGRRP